MFVIFQSDNNYLFFPDPSAGFPFQSAFLSRIIHTYRIVPEPQIKTCCPFKNALATQTSNNPQTINLVAFNIFYGSWLLYTNLSKYRFWTPAIL